MGYGLLNTEKGHYELEDFTTGPTARGRIVSDCGVTEGVSAQVAEGESPARGTPEREGAAAAAGGGQGAVGDVSVD